MKKDIRTLKVVQSNALVCGIQRMTAIQKKMVMYFIARLQGDKATKGRIYVTDLISDLKIERRNIYGVIEEYTDQIMSYVVKLPDKNSTKTYTKVNWFHLIRYVHAKENKEDRSYLAVQFHSDLKQYIFDLKKCFAVVPAVYLYLQTAHAIRLFEIIWHLSYNLTKDSVEVSVAELKKMLGVEKLYCTWEDFKKRVVVPSVASINELSCHNENLIRFALSCTYVRAQDRSRRVVGIAFNITKLKSAKAPKVILAQPDPNASKLSEYDEVIKLLRKVDIDYTDSEYIELIENNGGKDIVLASIKYAVAEDAKYKKKNLGGFVITCIEKQKGKAILEKRIKEERIRQEAELKKQQQRQQEERRNKQEFEFVCRIGRLFDANPDADFDTIKAGLGSDYSESKDELIKAGIENLKNYRKSCADLGIKHMF